MLEGQPQKISAEDTDHNQQLVAGPERAAPDWVFDVGKMKNIENENILLRKRRNRSQNHLLQQQNHQNNVVPTTNIIKHFPFRESARAVPVRAGHFPDVKRHNETRHPHAETSGEIQELRIENILWKMWMIRLFRTLKVKTNRLLPVITLPVKRSGAPPATASNKLKLVLVSFRT